MKMNRRNNRLAALLLAMMVALCGVSALAESTEDAATIAVVGENTEAAAEETAEAVEEAAEPVMLATVNGEEIWSNNKAMQELLSYYGEYYAAYGYDTSDPSLQSYLKSAGLQWAIEDALYRQKAQELNVAEITEEQKAELEAKAKEVWDENVSYFAEQQGLTEESTDEEKEAARVAALAQIEAQYGYTEESYISGYVESYKEVQLRQNVQNAVLGEFTVSEEEITDHFNELVEEDRANYENNVPMYEYYTNYMGNKSYYVPEGYRGITHILLDVDDELLKNYTDLAAQLEEQQEKETADDAAEGEPTEEPAAEAEATEKPAAEAEATEEPKEPVTQEMVDAARQAIMDSVQAQVDEITAAYAAGTSFGELIEKYGTDPGMKTEPNKTNGYAVHKESILWDPAFTEGAMSLNQVGDISEPVLGSYGIHILHYTRDIPAGAVELTDEIRNEFREELLQEKETEAVTAMIEEWRNNAELVYTEDGQAIMDAAAAQQNQESVTATEATEEALKDGE